MNILQINASARREAANSTRVADSIADVVPLVAERLRRA